jgi:hypothetical protein
MYFGTSTRFDRDAYGTARPFYVEPHAEDLNDVLDLQFSAEGHST